jgi:hypothetical protein
MKEGRPREPDDLAKDAKTARLKRPDEDLAAFTMALRDDSLAAARRRGEELKRLLAVPDKLSECRSSPAKLGLWQRDTVKA